MISATISKAYLLQLILKSMIFIFFATLFYIFYFTDVVNKFAEKDTTIIYSQETVEENKMNSPFITFCTNPRTKISISEKYKLSRGVLDAPNSNDTKILMSLNKTIEALFREVTFKLNRDFYFSINLWFYEDEFGWRNYTGKMTEGSNNYIEVLVINLEQVQI